jgi:hypothetical protein
MLLVPAFAPRVVVPPIFIGKGTARRVSAQDFSVPLNPDTANGDYLMLIIQCDDVGLVHGVTSGITNPVVLAKRENSLHELWVLGGFRAPDATSVGVNVHPAEQYVANVLTFRRVNPLNPVNAARADNISSGSSVVIPNVTTTKDKCLVVSIASHQVESSSPQFSGWANPSLESITELEDISTTLNWDGGWGAAAGVKKRAGAVADTTANNGSGPHRSASIALAPR